MGSVCACAKSDIAFAPSRARRLMGMDCMRLSVILAWFNSSGSRTSSRMNCSSDFSFSDRSVTVISGSILLERLYVQTFHVFLHHSARGELGDIGLQRFLDECHPFVRHVVLVTIVVGRDDGFLQRLIQAFG